MLLGPDEAVIELGEVLEECLGGGGVSNNENIFYRNFWYNPTYLLGDFSARNMGFLKQLLKPENTNISIEQTNPLNKGTHTTTYCADTRWGALTCKIFWE